MWLPCLKSVRQAIMTLKMETRDCVKDKKVVVTEQAEKDVERMKSDGETKDAKMARV